MFGREEDAFSGSEFILSYLTLWCKIWYYKSEYFDLCRNIYFEFHLKFFFSELKTDYPLNFIYKCLAHGPASHNLFKSAHLRIRCCLVLMRMDYISSNIRLILYWIKTNGWDQKSINVCSEVLVYKVLTCHTRYRRGLDTLFRCLRAFPKKIIF